VCDICLQVPSYIPVTKTVNIVYASLYTGCYMAVSSNLRYQLLQGVIEPAIDTCFRNIPVLRAAAIISSRAVNSLIGSMLAISGMRMLGLFQLR
jgi:Protein RETICULATA-related